MSQTEKTLEQSWNRIIEITRSLRNEAGEENWSEVASLAADRHRAVTEHFNRFPVEPTNAEFYRDNLSNFLSEEENIQQMALDARKSAMRSALKAQKNSRAISAYQDQ